MRRLAFLLALPLIGLAGFVLSFYSPNAAHAGAQRQSTESSVEAAKDDSCEPGVHDGDEHRDVTHRATRADISSDSMR